MDLSSFKLDIDELVDDFSQANLKTLSDMKRLWLAKKFSYIYEARPKSNSAFFMQSLFSHSIGHMCSSVSLSQRLGGLYCLYCLYCTQPYKPCFKIYLSLGELKVLKSLVADAKAHGIHVVPALVKRMLDQNMFLFGYSDISHVSAIQRASEIKKLQDKHLQSAYEKLLGNSGIEGYVHMNLGVELDLESFKRLSTEYAKAKEEAIIEASNSMDVEDIKHIAENISPASETIEELVGKWDAQKQAFYHNTGMGPCYQIVPADAEGFAELERLLDE
ncbi:hypothetical protein HPP92_025876 [Vanilla planifolia]|uniref:Uncharacterized protein n=1 Tax=Vanilla planifolia TaxID=51239 RepID=A0A835UAB8_VANPL|nr:hypothetical protein HPP92_026160 [Vanilla planifolia]KAG0452065.1 hypothetical protein HPP92_025876 [Vanilla planifolia]